MRPLCGGRRWHHHGAAFDLQAVCSGFVFALATADSLLRSGHFRALRIGAETFSRLLRLDRSHDLRVLFGDGAGAVVLDTRISRARATIAASHHASAFGWQA